MRPLGTQIVAARDLLKMTQAQLAAAAGVGENTVYRIEQEVGTPHRATLQAIQRALEERGITFTFGDRPSVTLDLSKATVSP